VGVRWILGVIGCLVGFTNQGWTQADPPPEPVIVPPEARIRILEEVVAKLQANHERLRAWKATCTYSDKLRVDQDPGYYQWVDGVAPVFPAVRENTGAIRFELDLVQQRFRVDFEPGPRSIFETPGTRTKYEYTEGPIPHQQRSILTMDRFWHRQKAEKFVRNSDIPGLKGNGFVAFRDPVEDGMQRADADVFNPLGMLRHSQVFWEELRSTLLALKGETELPPPWTPESVDQSVSMRWVTLPDEGRHLVILLTLPAGLGAADPVEITYTLSEVRNYFPRTISVDSPPGRTRSTKMWQSKLVDQVVVPEKWHSYIYEDDGDTVSSRRLVVLREQEVNPPLDDALFDHRGLELADGDVLIDRVDRLGFRVRDGQLVDPIAYGTAEADLFQQSRGDSFVVPIMVGLNVAVLVFLCIMVLRKKRPA
jgi:hypothetical protein